MNGTGSRPAALLAGAVLLALGVLGFVPAVTTRYGELAFAGHGPAPLLLGLFAVSILSNLVHAALGAAGLVLASTPERARTYLLSAGAALLALWLLGVVKAGAWVPLNTPDNWLHLGLGVTLLGLARVAEPAA